MARFFLRLDDVAPNMNWDNFSRIVAMFRKYGIKPLMTVIPDNQDPELLKYPFSSDFWQITSQLSRDGWMIAQHGYRHLYETKDGGILKINNQGEFSGLDFIIQKTMISCGKKIIAAKISDPEIFAAPGHSFDKNTIIALRENGFKYISDGIALYPFEKWGIMWLPQVLWRPRKWLFGIITVTLHPNTMNSEEINNLEKFIKESRSKIGNFSELLSRHDRQNIIMKFSNFFINQAFKFCWRIIFKLKHGLSG